MEAEICDTAKATEPMEETMTKAGENTATARVRNRFEREYRLTPEQMIEWEVVPGVSWHVIQSGGSAVVGSNSRPVMTPKVGSSRRGGCISRRPVEESFWTTPSG